jgi:hypothetical protein
MFNPIQFYEFGKSRGGIPNTFIGGVSASIGTAQLLADKMFNYPSRTAFSVSNIKNFTVVGNDIKCLIDVDFSIGGLSTNVIPNILTNFTHNGTYLKRLESLALANQTNMTLLDIKSVIILDSQATQGLRLKEYAFPNCTTLNGQFHFNFIENQKTIYLPNCTAYGVNTSNNSIFTTAINNCKIYANTAMQTVNAGAEEPDILQARNNGAIIIYVENYTVPNAVSDLSSGTIYKTAIQLNFTSPSSTNVIDYYECYADGVFKNNITASGQFITGLTANTAYQFTVIAVDIFYNKSVVSNSVSASTNNTSAVPITGLVSYYKLESSSVDSYGTNNGVDTAVTYGVGKIGNGAIYNGSTSKTIIGNPANLQLSQGTVMCWVKATASGSSYRSIFGKTLAYNMFLTSGVFMVFNWGSFGGVGNKSSGVNLNDGLWHHVAFVFESGTANNFLYLDGVLKLTFSWSVSNQTDNVCIGSSNSVQLINASIDESAIYNTKLTQSQISLIYNNGNGITL